MPAGVDHQDRSGPWAVGGDDEPRTEATRLVSQLQPARAEDGQQQSTGNGLQIAQGADPEPQQALGLDRGSRQAGDGETGQEGGLGGRRNREDPSAQAQGDLGGQAGAQRAGGQAGGGKRQARAAPSRPRPSNRPVPVRSR